MSTAATMSTPVVPPRPSRSPSKDAPKVPPRPIRAAKSRDLSPDDRFAPSPLNEGFAKSAKGIRFSPNDRVTEFENELETETTRDTLAPTRPPVARMPSEVGEEGNEYDVAEEIREDEERRASAIPESHTVGDIEIHAPHPSLPTKLDAVTNTTSERAAALGLVAVTGSDIATSGSLRKKTSTSALSTDGNVLEDEHGIPEIGRRVPMIPNAGDVQAPESLSSSRNHSRAQSTRGLPPGSYGLHSHGVISKDKLEKEYYEKHPEILQKEQKQASYNPRQVDYARSSADLNKIVHDTHVEDEEFGCGPTEDIAQLVQEEYVSRYSSPIQSRAQSPEATRNPRISIVGDGDIHIDKNLAEESEPEDAPILASDEVAKEPFQSHTPAIEVERRSSDDHAKSRPASRPVSFYGKTEETEPEEKKYEPLFNDDGSEAKKEATEKLHTRHKFPSKDIWEDAPSSAHYTAEVNTPADEKDEIEAVNAQEEDKEDEKDDEEEEEHVEEGMFSGPKVPAAVDPSEPLNPALAFAKLQEELAEKEMQSRDSSLHHTFVPRGVGMQPRSPAPLSPEAFRPKSTSRFPSRDIWEDTPDSHMMSTTVDGNDEPAPLELGQPVIERKPEVAAPAAAAAAAPVVPARPASNKPAIPDRPKPKPAVSDRPKPAIPARPSVARPVGGKIAALQAGFMSDLNRRLQLGPQAPKKEEPAPPVADEPTAEPEKPVLSDARKGRARGPPRRAPAKVAAPAVEASEAAAPVLSFSISKPQLLWSILPTGAIGFEGTVGTAVKAASTEKPAEQEKPVEEAPVETKAAEEVATKAPVADAVEVPAAAAVEEAKVEEAKVVEETPAEEVPAEKAAVEDATPEVAIEAPLEVVPEVKSVPEVPEVAKPEEAEDTEPKATEQETGKSEVVAA